MQHIVNIPLSQLRHHPKNPRLDLGDLSELVESIKYQGVLQNLTVVPSDEEGIWWVLIGNRRFEASRLAGLEELPCSISNMSMDEQIGTMLAENMQREDLTLWEQANGLQMMMDLNLSVEGIASRTGLSKTTVNRRLKLVQFGKEAVDAGTEKGATLMDWMLIDKLTDPKNREKAVQAIGTANFKWIVECAEKEEIRQAWYDQMIAKVEGFAKKLTLKKGEYRWEVCSSCMSFKRENGVPDQIVPPNAKTQYYYDPNGDQFDICIKKPKENTKDSGYAEKQRLQEEERKQRKEVSKMAYDLRMAFVKEYRGAKKHLPILVEYMLKMDMAGGPYHYLNWKMMYESFGATPPKDKCDYTDFAEESMERLLLSWMAHGGSVSTDNDDGYFSYGGMYRENERLTLWYALLEKLGYTISDEERQLINGTHPLFKTPEPPVAEANEDDEDLDYTDEVDLNDEEGEE